MTVARNLIVLILIVQSTVIVCGQQSKKFFRKDYTYLASSFGFYKIHTIHRNWQDAKNRCALEGASLFYPEDKNEADVVLDLWNRTQPFSWVYIGVSDLIAKGVFESIDGRSIFDIYNNWGPGEPNDYGGVEDCVILRRDGTLNDDRCDRIYPFICKKSLDSLVWNTECDMPYKDYVFHKDLGKCYKFHLKPKNWTDAYITCSVEESYLAVVDSQAEADYLVTMTAQANKDKVTGDYSRGAVFLGFHNKDGDGWRTIKNVPLEESGYSKWGNQQPDGGDREKCGSIFYNGQYNDMGCDRRCFFICEHDIGSLSNSYDDRFSDLLQ